MVAKSHDAPAGVLNECKVDCPCHESGDLSAGQFYGAIAQKREVAGCLLSELHHDGERRLPRHSHEAAYFSLLIDGSYAETYGSHSHEYQPLTIWYHKPGIVHQDEIGARGGTFFNLELLPDFGQELALESPPRDDFFEQGTALVWIACRLFRELRDWQPCSPLTVESLSLEMAAHSVKRKDSGAAPRALWLSRVVEQLNDEISETHSMTQLARTAGVHPVHLAAVFRRTHRQTVGDYLRAARVRRAAVLLCETARPLADIAALLGFADQSHFTRHFRREVGITPGAFRQTFGRNSK